jgi:hypothetical protein
MSANSYPDWAIRPIMEPGCCVSSDAGVRLSVFDEGRLEPGVQAIAHLVSENCSVSGVWMLGAKRFSRDPALRAVYPRTMEVQLFWP